MTKNKKIIIVIVIAAILMLAVWWWKKKSEEKPEDQSVPDAEKPPVVLGSPFPLHKGSSGKEVKQLQTWLYKQHGGDINKLLGPNGIDGKFGSWTENATNKVTKNLTVSEAFFKEKGMDKISVQ